MFGGNELQRSHRTHTICAAALLVACCAGTSLADSPTELFRRGNDLMRQGKAAEAVKAYTEAQSGGSSSAVDAAIPPHFADVLLYNLGSAQLAAGNLAEADRSLRAVIERSQDPSLRAKAGFNLGSLDATRAEQLAEEKPQEAVDTYRKAERFFRAALTDDPSDSATRENIDAVQRRIAALLEKFREQEEQRKQQEQQQQSQQQQGGQGKDTKNDKAQQNQGQKQDGDPQQQPDQQQQQQSASDALNRLSQEQKEQSRKSEEQAKQQASDEKSKQQAESAQKQEDLRKQTEQAAEQLRQQAEKTQDPKQKEQLQEAAKKAQDATEQQRQAERDLKQGDSEQAAEQQKQAAEKLSEAQAHAERADEMRAEQEKQQQDRADAQKGDQQKGQQQQQQAAQEAQEGKDGQQRPFDATAAQILDKEKENKRLLERYYRQLRGRPAPVKKDW